MTRLIFGERNEIACIPHEGCRLEITATAPSPHRKAELLLPGQVIRYMNSFFRGDRFVLPNGCKVKLPHLVGFKLQLASRPVPRPLEDVVTLRRTIEPGCVLLHCTDLGSSRSRGGNTESFE